MGDEAPRVPGGEQPPERPPAETDWVPSWLQPRPEAGGPAGAASAGEVAGSGPGPPAPGPVGMGGPNRTPAPEAAPSPTPAQGQGAGVPPGPEVVGPPTPAEVRSPQAPPEPEAAPSPTSKAPRGPAVPPEPESVAPPTPAEIRSPSLPPEPEAAASPTPKAAQGPSETPEAAPFGPAPAPGASLEQMPTRSPAGPYPPGGRPEPPADGGALEDAFLTIWNRPRETIRRIVAVDPGHWVLALASLGGAASVLSNASSNDLGDRMSLGSILLMAVIGGPLAGILTLYVFGWMVRKTGEWFLHGRATPPEIRAALAWAYVPHAAMLPLLLLATVLVPGLYRSDVAASGPVAVFFGIAIGLLVLALTIWAVVIGAHTMAEVQGYRSAWKGLWNLILPGLLLAGLVIVVALVVGGLAGLVRGS